MKLTKREWQVEPEPLDDELKEIYKALNFPLAEPKPRRYLTRVFTVGKIRIEWAENLNDDVDRKEYSRVQWCIPCGHISIYRGQGYSSKTWDSIKYAFGKPEYVGDCRHLHINLPIKASNRWFGIQVSYKTESPWDKPGFKEKQ